MAATPGRCCFLEGIERLDLPIAHGEGKFVCRDADVLERLRSNGQIVLRYADSTQSMVAAADSPLPYPINPNGSEANIAGICDPTGRVFGLMPHPERYVDDTQHPQWTRRSPAGGATGLAVFQNAVRYLS
jgi:phosphoribosylformylglycinamidine synthase